jgi:hypothetical protein
MATNEDNPVLAGPAPNLDVEGFVRFSGYASMLALGELIALLYLRLHYG